MKLKTYQSGFVFLFAQSMLSYAGIKNVMVEMRSEVGKHPVSQQETQSADVLILHIYHTDARVGSLPPLLYDVVKRWLAFRQPGYMFVGATILYKSSTSKTGHIVSVIRCDDNKYYWCDSNRKFCNDELLLDQEKFERFTRYNAATESGVKAIQLYFLKE